MSYQWNISGLSPADRALGVYIFPVFRVEYQWIFPTALVEYNIHFIYLWYRPALMQTVAAYKLAPAGLEPASSMGVSGPLYH